jgi:hypothetical protein
MRFVILCVLRGFVAKGSRSVNDLLIPMNGVHQLINCHTFHAAINV